ncbi:MAG TPA: ABC transporter ATP-binding protein [Blastocatellia bacterium]|nr:ABC transporter ATP-binding protein [Blastocatellia bacterium]
MSNLAIKVEHLSKRYRIGMKEQRPDTLAGAVSAMLKSPLSNIRKLRNLSRFRDHEEADVLWALRDVSFDVRHGDVVGIIGRNGAGKSTLLKILAKITDPTSGRIEITGRVASLLEVGTGFHPELTGRENVYLNGAVLGMRRGEIDRKFAEIVEFSGVEKFIDTPVKHYSSGMRVRLAFSVAAHLEPEILLIDEVLAVGDAAFQKKCLGKMGDVARDGRTVLFVSHNMGALVSLCPKSILLVDGEKKAEGPSDAVVSDYLEIGAEGQGEALWDPSSAPGNDNVRLRAVRVVAGDKTSADVDIEQDINVEIEFWNLKQDAQLAVSVHLKDQMGVSVLSSLNAHSANLIRDQWFGKAHPVGLFRSVCRIPSNLLNDGRYTIRVLVLSDMANREVCVDEAVSFFVHDTGAMRREYRGKWVGVVRPKLAWDTELLIDGAPAAVRELPELVPEPENIVLNTETRLPL